MTVTIDDLIMQIEELRLELVEIKVATGYSDPEVVRASQKLDKVLNEYQELVKLTKSDYLIRIK